jgi:hypothetical protein
MLHIGNFLSILYVSWNSIYWCTFLIRTSFLRSIMLMLNTYSSTLYGHYYFHEHTELCFTANTCKPSCGTSYLLTRRQVQDWKALCTRVIQAGLLLRNFFFRNFALTRLENLQKLLTYGILLDLLMVTWVQYVIMLINLQKVLSLDLKCLCSKSTTVVSEWTVPKSMDVSLLQFYCIRNK